MSNRTFEYSLTSKGGKASIQIRINSSLSDEDEKQIESFLSSNITKIWQNLI